MKRFQPATIQMIACALAPSAQTPREIQALLPLDFCRGSVRQVLQRLVQEGRAVAEGDLSQKRYRLAEVVP